MIKHFDSVDGFQLKYTYTLDHNYILRRIGGFKKPITPWVKDLGYRVVSLKLANGRFKKVGFHRIIYQVLKGPIPKGMEIDHINNDPSDNRVENLRLANRLEQVRNMKKQKGRKFKGVAIFKRTGKWRAYVSENNKVVHLGYFDTELEGALAYDRYVLKNWGQFAHTNILKSLEEI